MVNSIFLILFIGLGIFSLLVSLIFFTAQCRLRNVFISRKNIVVKDLLWREKIFNARYCNTISSKVQNFQEREKIFSMLPEDQKKEMIALFDEFDEHKTAEAKFARAMDNLQPLLLNNSNNGIDWKSKGINAEQIYERQSKTKLGSEKLFEITDRIIKENIEKGNIKK